MIEGIKTITRPVSGDGMCGFDEFNQFWVFWRDDYGAYVGSIMRDLREAKCSICGNSWEASSESLRNQFFVNMTQEHVHNTCHLGHVALEEARMFYDALLTARGKLEVVWDWKKIPNEYRGSRNTPWYRVWFKDFVPYLKLGARRHVFHMSMHDLRPDQVKAWEKFVEKETATKGTDRSSCGVYIHAWNRDEVLRHLAVFYEILLMDQPVIRDTESQIFRLELKNRQPKELTQGEEPQQTKIDPNDGQGPEPKQTQIDPNDGQGQDSRRPRVDSNPS